ncbi:MAG: 30S ribosomal protein S8 [Holophagaceae bacterium]|jgi:small subunit ribosomal protein S8|uniref:Small ribosomal subunit protein uS8 n=1 Tax=Candidatus Geothrix skivensis TaxID=2954439 RepID=A0A9D7SEK6_9BACT|nr:30S ribosomal protein S8 [Candidatus Geothrix skivensis]MBK9797651.1 30S ribosomal protein S8 [Candidatus Geothrix skivensis]
MNTDPIADYLTRIRNGIMAGHDAVVVPSSKIKAGLCGILKQEGYIHSFKQVEHEGREYLILNLKYVKDKENVIHGLRRVSRPGLRIYSGAQEIAEVHGGLGIAILSTPKGLLTGKDAKKQNVGGEILAHVW